jgi:hypothetical protein
MLPIRPPPVFTCSLFYESRNFNGLVLIDVFFVRVAAEASRTDPGSCYDDREREDPVWAPLGNMPL